MSARVKVWSTGVVLTAILVGSLGLDASSRELRAPAALLALGVCALVAEGVSLRSLARSEVRPGPPPGALPADGIVDVVPVDGVEGTDNPARPGFRRFVRLADDRQQPSASGELSPTNPTLLGRAVLISVFVGRDGGRWTDRELARAHEALERAGLWIEREAARHGAPVNVGLAGAYFVVEDDAADPVEVAFSPEGDDLGPMEADASIKAVAGASRAAALLGFSDVADLLGRINPRVEANAAVWLFHLRRAGRSLAIPAADCDVSGVGLAICYSRETSFPEPLTGPGRVDPTTVAHEVLHLFGAADKYGVGLRSFPSGSVSSRDIMRLDHDSLFRMTIDRLTASEIGWGRPEMTNPRASK